MTFNVKEEVAKRHFFLKNILENSIGDEELEINRINYNILLKQIKDRYFVKFEFRNLPKSFLIKHVNYSLYIFSKNIKIIHKIKNKGYR